MLRISAVASRRPSALLAVLLVFAAGLSGHALHGQSTAASHPVARVQARVDNTKRVTLAGHTLGVLRNASDLGRLPVSTPMNHLVMVLQPTPEQDHALQTLLDQQLDSRHANFHKWIKPDEFGARFGIADADIAQVTGWLQQQGFAVEAVSPSKRFIQFSGNVGLVETAFQTEMHRYNVAGEVHVANSSNISVPAALQPVIAGVPTLHDFFKKSNMAGAQVIAADQDTGKFYFADPLRGNMPDYTNGTTHFLGAGDFATVYNTTPLLTAGNDGTGVSIGIIGRTDIHLADVQMYRTFFGLKANDPTFVVAGEDPGVIGGDDGESYLDVEVSGGAAPGAAVKFITSRASLTVDGVDLAAMYAVQNNLTDIISESYGQCEANFSAVQAAFYSNLWAQAAAQGQSVFVSSGDNGPASCDSSNNTYATDGYAVSMLASSPYNVAVGGTLFADTTGGPWWGTTATAAPPFSSALAYIPEVPWNEAKGSGATGASGLWSGSGGISAYFLTPAWQRGFGVPTTDPAYAGTGAFSSPSTPFVTGPHRYMPDVSMAAAAQHDGTLYCAEGICQLSSTGTIVNAGIVGGTSVAAPTMAGVQALVDQYNGGRQGLPNYVYYALADAQHTAGINCASNTAGATLDARCAFRDVTTGNNLVCTDSTGSSTCTAAKKIGWTAAAGYDLATGLGSPNATQLAHLWQSITFRSTTTTQNLSQTTGITHGQSVTISGTVAPGSGTGTPTGTVAFILSSGSLTNPMNASGGFTNPVPLGTLDASGNYSVSVTDLPAGTYYVTARYGGDGTFASSLSSPIQVTVAAENSGLTIQPNAFNGSTCVETPTTTFTYGSYIWTDFTVAGISGQGIPSGTLMITDNSNPLISTTLNPNGQAHTLSGAIASSSCVFGYTVQDVPVPSVGTHVIGASYSGDSSFNSLTATPVTITINPATVAGSLATSATNISSGSPVQLTFTTTALSGAGPGTLSPTGTVTFTDTTTATVLGTASLSPSSTLGGALAILTTTGITTSGANSITASYAGDTNYNAITSSAVTVTVQSGTATSVAVTSNANPTTVGGRPTWTATMTPTTVTSGTVSFYDSGVLLGTGPVGGAHTATFRPAASVSLTAGVHSITASYQGNATFNASVSPVFSQTFNQTATTVQLTVKPSGTYGESFTMNAALGLTGTVVPGATGTITFFDGGTQIGSPQPITIVTAAAGGLGIWQAQMQPNLTAGTHTITATFSDSNYTAPTSNSQTITVAKATAALALSNTVQNYTGSPLPVTVTTTPAGLTTVTVTYTGTGSTVYGPSTTAPTNVGTYAVAAVLTNANYTGTQSGTLTINQAAPTITSISPTGGPTSGGTVVTVTGTSFSNVTGVAFGGTAATSFTVNSAASISATAPPAAGTGTVDVTVTTPAGTSPTSSADQFTYAAPQLFTVTTLTDDATGVAVNCVAGATDATGGNGNCSLRDAIAAAELVGGLGISSNTAINFLPSLTASATQAAPAVASTATGGVLTVTNGAPLTINGPTSGSGSALVNLLAIDGGNTNARVLNIYPGGSATGSTTLNNLVIRNGGNGGINVNGGTVALNNSTVSGNSSSGSGGGLFIGSGTVTVSGSTFAGNTSGNTGGGIRLQGGTLTISNSTIANNVALTGGGLSMGSGLVAISDSTFAVNKSTLTPPPPKSGDFAVGGGTLTLKNTIVSDDFVGSFTDGGGNITSATNLNLGTLGFNGGPTQTLVPQPGSTAICGGLLSSAAGSPATVAAFADQRGLAPGSGYCTSSQLDSGAVQTSYAISYSQNISANVSSGVAITPAPSIAVTENSIPVAGAPVIMTAATGTLGGTTTVSSASTGLATFSNLTISQGVTGDTLTATLNLGPTAGAPQLTATSSTFSSLAIGPATIPAPSVATPYSQQITGSNGTAPYSYAVSTGTLPTGLSLAQTGANAGLISGTPTAGGTFSFTVQTTDANSTTASQAYTVVVGLPTITLMASSAPSFTVGTAPNLGFTANGGTAPYTYTVSAGSLPLGLSLSSTGVISGTPTTAGPYSFTVKATDSSTGTGPYFATQTYTGSVQKGTAQVVLRSLLQTYTGSGIAATASTAPNGLTVTFLYGPVGSTPSSATLPILAGSYAVSATVVDANYQGFALDTLVIAKATPTITFNVGTHTYLDAPFAVSASSPSTGAFTYSVVSGPATVAGPTVTITGAGQVTLQASQATDANYTAATQNVTFTVNKAAPAITFTVPGTHTYLDAPFAVSASSNSTGAYSYTVVSGQATVSGSTVTLTGAGPVTLQVSQATDANFLAGTKQATFTVNKAPAPAITFVVPTHTYLNGPFTVSASSASTGAFTYTYVSGPATLSGSTVTLTGAGTVMLLASQATDQNYLAGSQSTTFIVNKAVPTITFNVANHTYLDAPFAVSAASNSTGAITYSVVSGNATVAGSTVTITGAGPVTLRATEATDVNFTASTQDVTFNVAQATPTLTFSVGNHTFGDAPFTVSATSNSTGAFAYSVVSGPASVVGSTVTLTGAGPVVLQASEVSDGNFTPGTKNASFTVAQGNATITFTVPTHTYLDAPFSVSASSPSNGAITYSVVSGPATISGRTVTLTGAGNVTLQASQAADVNYLAGTKQVTFVSNQATPTITFNVLGHSFGDAPFSISANSNSTGAFTYSVVSGPATVSGNTVTLTGAGNVTLQASEAADTNFVASTKNVTFIVAQTTPTITFNVPNHTFGDAPFTVAATSGSTGAYTYSVVSGPATVSGSTVTLTGAGTVTLQVSQAADANYLAGSKQVTFNVALGSPTITFNVPNHTYGDAAFTVTATSPSTGAITYSVLSGPATISGSTVTLTGAGTVVLQASQAADANYLASVKTATVIVSSATLTVKVADVTRFYGQANPTFTGTATGGAPGDVFSVTGTTTATSTSPVGTYAIVPTVAGSNIASYTVNVSNGTLTVAKAPTVSVLSLSSPSISPVQTETLTATVASTTIGVPTGTVNFFDGTTQLNATPIALNASGGAAITVSLASGTHNLSVVYSGDGTYQGSSNTNTSTVTVAPLEFTLALASGTGTLVVYPGQTGTLTFNVSSLYGSFPSTVNIAISGLPSGLTTSLSPSTFAANSAGGPVTLSVSVPANFVTENRTSSPFGYAPVAFGFLMLPLFAVRRVRRSIGGRISLMLLLLGVGVTAMSGCGGTGSSSITTAPKSYAATITVTSGAITHTLPVTVNVQ